jgi:hypothetical protein
MTDDILTAESTFRKDLYDRFYDHALDSYEKSMQAFNDRDFYVYVHSKFQRGVDLTGDLPELNNLDKGVASKVMLAMEAKALKRANDAWELNENQASCFVTTIRSRIDEGELIPCFDIEYAGKDDYANAKIKVTTWRRYITVEVIGTESELEKMSKQLFIATMWN